MRFLSFRTAPALAWGLVLAGLPADSVRAVEPAIQWRADYNAARKEAQEKGLPLLVEVGTEDCFYCKKQDATTFRDPGLIALVNARFVPVRVDANRDPAFAQALRVQLYPTTVLGAPDGRILSFLQGYTSADQMRDHLRRAAPAVTVSDVTATSEPADPPGRPRAAQAWDLLAAAREAFRAKRYADCLDACDRLAAGFADLPEGKEGETLAARVTGDPVRLAAACEQMAERTANLYLTLADTWEKKGQPQEARPVWRRRRGCARPERRVSRRKRSSPRCRSRRPECPFDPQVAVW